MARRRSKSRNGAGTPPPEPAQIIVPSPPFEIFLSGTPGLEDHLADEARALGFDQVAAVPGGVTMTGDWAAVWRANILCRGATRVLVRLVSFRALHLAQLDKRARRVDWAAVLGHGRKVTVETTCRGSRIYHAGAASQRIEAAVAEVVGDGDAAPLKLFVRIEDDLCTVSLDSTGAPLHKRGTKLAVGKAPMRETLAALCLRDCGYDGQEPIYDPMCGSGTFVIEAAEIAAGLAAGRARSFAFEGLAQCVPEAVAQLRDGRVRAPAVRFYGSDRDAGAVAAAEQNAERAGVSEWSVFRQCPVSDILRPEGPSGLVIVNPPYGARIGNRKLLFGLYGALGEVLKARFSGWRVGLVTSDSGLARATGLPWQPLGPPIPHGGLKVRLFKTAGLP